MRHRVSFWKNDRTNHLVLLIPGGSGTRRFNGMAGFNTAVKFFFELGYSCRIVETAGQDGLPGKFSLNHCLEESREIFARSKEDLHSPQTFLFASCSGGTIATYLAKENPEDILAMALWETPPTYPSQMRETFAARAASNGIQLSENFFGEYIETIDAASEVRCPVMIGYGDATAPPICTDRDMHALASAFSATKALQVLKIRGADHNLTRGSDMALLGRLLLQVEAFFDGYGSESPAISRSPGGWRNKIIQEDYSR